MRLTKIHNCLHAQVKQLWIFSELRKLFLDRPQDHNGAGVGQCRIADHLIPAIDGLRNTAAAPSGICK